MDFEFDVMLGHGLTLFDRYFRLEQSNLLRPGLTGCYDMGADMLCTVHYLLYKERIRGRFFSLLSRTSVSDVPGPGCRRF